MARPVGAIERKPTKQTIWFGGMPINQWELAKAAVADKGHVSRILRGLMMPSLNTAMKLAAVLGLSLDEFMDNFRAAKEARLKEHQRLTDLYYNRIAAEDTEDTRTIKNGGVPAPRNPAYRLPPDSTNC